MVSRHGWTRCKTDPMVFWHASGALMSVFADDLLVICERRLVDVVKHSIDKEMKVIWGGSTGRRWRMGSLLGEAVDCSWWRLHGAGTSWVLA